ncbi:MAG: PEGA domain-containing protein [Archangium sp.]|nr:PEGA domain-containing protein [Archangium sp.]
MMGLGAQVTKAILTEAKNQKVDLVSPDDLRSKMDAKRYESLKKCGGKPACVAQELESFGIKRAVMGQLSRDEKNYILKLWLIDIPGLTVVADVDRSILIAARRFQKDVEQAVPPLLRGEREARGTLSITANLGDAQITMNGEFIGAPPVTLNLKPGKYEVKIERKKYLPITRLIGVEANQETKAEFKLLLIPGQVPDDQIVPALTRKPDDDKQPTTVTLSALTWILGGTAIASGGAGFIFGLISRGQFNALNAGYNPDTMVFLGTRAQALEQNRNATIANITFAVGGAALVGAIISGIVDGTRAAPVTVTPTVTVSGNGTGTGGGVSVAGAF